MKNFFSKIKNGIGKVLTNIKKAIGNLIDKIKNVFSRIRNKNKENSKINESNNNPVVSNENVKGISNERQTIHRDNTVSMNSDTKFKTTGYDTFVAPIVINKTQKNNNISNKEVKNETNQDNELYSEEIDNTLNTENIENTERIVSIEIKEDIGIVEFETSTQKKYQKNIEDILRDKKNIYKNWNVNKKCNDFAKNKIQALRLKRKLNPIIISTLNNEEDIDNYIKCVRDTEKIWFNLEHDLTNSKLKGKNARLMERVGKHEEKIGAKVKRKESLIKRMLKKIRAKNKEPEEMVEEVKQIEEDNNALSGIEDEIIEDINEVENKKIKKEEEKLAQKEFKERYVLYATLIRSLHGLKPRKKLEEIMNDIVDKDIYNLTDKDAWTRAVATFNVGHRLSMTKPNEAKKYLNSAYDQLKKEELLTKNEYAYQYLEDTLLNLEEIYIRENNFRVAGHLNGEYMKIVEREKKERLNSMLLEYKKNGLQIKEIDVMIEYRKKYVAGQKTVMKILYKAGYKFEAEELYRKILNESGITLTDEEYDLSIQGGCIESGKYIVMANGITYRKPILGNEKQLLIRNELTQKLIKDKMNPSIVESSKATPINMKPKVEPKATSVNMEAEAEPKTTPVNMEPKVEPKATPVNMEAEAEPKTTSVNMEPKVEPKTELEFIEVKHRKDMTLGNEGNNTKKKGIITRKKETIDNIAKERTEKIKEKKAKEELIRKKEEERRKLAEEKKRLEEERRKLEEQKKAKLAEFNKRYNDYNVLARGILGGVAKMDLQAIQNDVIHNDIYNMTSDDETTKSIATFRVGHKLATLPEKRKEAERLLKTAIDILKKDEVLEQKNNAFEYLESAQLDLVNLFIENSKFYDADKQIIDYMNTVKREKIEKYDPKIIKAREEQKKLVEIDCWIEYEAKLVKGKKASIKLLCSAGQNEMAEKLYKQLLQDSGILLNDEEYELSKNTGCIESGKYMKIMKNRTYRKNINGGEYLYRKRSNIEKQVLKEINDKYNAELEEERQETR